MENLFHIFIQTAHCVYFILGIKSGIIRHRGRKQSYRGHLFGCITMRFGYKQGNGLVVEYMAIRTKNLINILMKLKTV